IERHVTGRLPWHVHEPRARDREPDHARVLEALAQAVPACEATLRRVAEASGSSEPMTTAVSVAYMVWPALYLVSTGDAAAYLLRRGQLYALGDGRDGTGGAGGAHPPAAGQARAIHIPL